MIVTDATTITIVIDDSKISNNALALSIMIIAQFGASLWGQCFKKFSP
jgi:hypothetical protein